MAWKIFKGLIYQADLQPVRLHRGPAAYECGQRRSAPRSVVVMDNARIHCSEELQEMCNEAGMLLVDLFTPLLAGLQPDRTVVQSD
jgi:hypothetical protein